MDQKSILSRKIDWEAVVAEQEKSGMPQKEFCEERGLILTTFVYHRCRIKKNSREAQRLQPSFKPVKVIKNDEASAIGDIRLSLPNGFQCAFPCQLDSTQIKRLVEVLLSC